jgi:ribosomal protein S18 acetylase RimI-like enzyme
MGRAMMPRPRESELFGVRIASAEPTSVARVAQATVNAREWGAELLVLRVNAEQQDLVQAAEHRGGRMCDTLLTLTRTVTPADDVAVTWPAGLSPDVATVADADALHVLGKAAFAEFAGHWHADPRLDNTLATELYGRWAADLARHTTANAPVLLARTGDGKPCGFLALATDDDGWHVPLTGVHPDCRGRGLLRALLQAAMAHIARALPAGGRTTFAYETQAVNWPALRVVTAAGFVPSAARMTFHLWTGDAP